MGIRSQAVLLGILGLGLAGCCDEEGRRRAGAVGTVIEAPGMGAAVTDASVAGMSLAHASIDGLVIQPKVLRVNCSGAAGASAEVEVNWTSDIPGLAFVQITVGSLTQAPKVWVEGGGAGSETTGAWINDGSVLTLLDGTGRTLGTVRAMSTACAPTGG